MMFVNAVPFGLARLQSNVSKTVLNIAESCRVVDNNDMRILPRLKSPLKRTSTTNSSMLKKRNKRFHNRQSARASSEKIKLQKDFLDQMLLDINMEKMRLFLENEDLKQKCSLLEEENHFLQLQLQASQSSQNKKNQMCEETFNSSRSSEQLSTETIDCIPSFENVLHFEQLDKISDASNWNDETDVFIASISQDIITQPEGIDVNAVARIIDHEEIIYCDEAEISDVEMEISFPEPYTFDNLYEDSEDEMSFYF
ncbi:uncharacterized protein CEXT_250461 [Caerostris extrusa]|uniref:BZIP domain-containing protein n=1 Tax=Caerostris extrusa TaxID=172846 RepID=A0AAV4U9D8_CAEEX|nr:uncharacterized protein CEXT_250461 [Caerostris extrusa]